MNFGPLGFPRLTGVGPFVKDLESLFSQPAIDEAEYDDVFDEVLEQNNIQNPSDLSKSEKSRLAKGLGFITYPDEDLVQRKKRARFFQCMQNKWARKWAQGLARETNVARVDDDESMFRLRYKGCISVTETNMPDDPRLVTDEVDVNDRPELPEEIP